MYGALVDRRADCTGFANAFTYILGRLGIECLFINGLAPTGENHSWNAIKLDGEWYQTDVSWDGSFSKREGLPYHCYFNRTERALIDLGYVFENTLGDINPAITSTATKYNYYIMTDSHIASDADFKKKVPICIANAKAQGKQMFELEFDPSYAQPPEITDKQTLLDSSDRSGLAFKYSKTTWTVFGVFQ
jgi:hypothetical protein